MATNRILTGLAAWALSMGVLAVTWGYAVKTAGPRGVVTAPIGLLALGTGAAAALFIAGVIVLIGAKRSGLPPTIR